MNRSRQISRNKLFKLLLSAALILGVLIGCNPPTPGPDDQPGFVTWTPSVTPTPTCSPNIKLSTPEGWEAKSRLVIVVFDVRPIENQYLELVNGDRTQDISSFIHRIVPELIRPGDQISGFHLGYSDYVSSRVMREYSYISRPQLYNTPSARDTLTPIPPRQGTPVPGLQGYSDLNAFEELVKEHSLTATAQSVIYDCEKNIWNSDAKLTATAWAKTEAAEIGGIAIKISDSGANGNPAQTPFLTDELYYGGIYYGLYFASIDMASDCAKYNECLLIIVDDMSIWGRDNPDHLPIRLSGAQIVVIMPNCRDINQPNCKRIQDYWDIEFNKFGADKATYFNGTHVEANILNKFGR